MEVQAVVEHEPSDEWVKRKTQSAEEMGKKNNPLMGPRGGDELPLVGERVRDVAGQISGAAQLLDVPSVTEEAIHLPPTPDIVGEG